MQFKYILNLAYRQALQDMREEKEFLATFKDEWSIQPYLDAKDTVKQIVDIMNGDAEVQFNA